QELITILSLMGATMILLFLGVKDDLVVVGPRKKILGQIVAATIVVLLADIRIFGFEGLFWIGELPYFISLLFSVFVFVALINAFNLIDGVDGLAGIIAILVSLAFGVFFFLNESILNIIVSFVLIGAIAGFLRYNFSERNKIFMGDTGSMVVGFLLSFQVLSFLEPNAQETTQFSVSNGPVMALAVLAYPILDTLRVFVIRIRDGRSPFSADRNHIHHRCLGLGLNHKKTTFLLTILNILIIQFALVTSDLYINVHAFMILVVVPLVFELPFLGQWLPNTFGVKNKAEAPKIADEPKVIPIADLRSMPSTYLGSTPHMYSEYIYQPLKTQGTQSRESKDEESADAQKISAKRVSTLRKVLGKQQSKKTAK
ncbi:MAG: undecaprenyl/decaprenyl-phosphate alpha-N-acetylglucosaminyl 1-phosphate transferase, partial [Eudoraea sp.]|nr:undecaprenyl/decaprenyl-phosphate alpha-N-acetylglucosaminyl 1-phosphate transferase [Eudoraea sp.]